MDASQRDLFAKVLRRFRQEGVGTQLILIGSWVEVIYQECGVVPDSLATTRTQDLDFLVNRKSRPHAKVDLKKVLIELGFTVDVDLLDGGTKFDFFDEGTALYVEFLTHMAGAGHEPIVLVKNLGVSAQALRHLDILEHNLVEVKFQDIPLAVPTPSAYVLQKMVISSGRKEDKREKDARSIEELLWSIQRTPRLLEQLRTLHDDFLTAKQRLAVHMYCEERDITLFPDPDVSTI